MTELVLLVLLVFFNSVNGDAAQPSLRRKLGNKPELFQRTWSTDKPDDPFVAQTGCKLQPLLSEAICGGDYGSGGAPEMKEACTGICSRQRGVSTTFFWRVDCTEMKDQRGDDNGTFVLHVGTPSFKSEQPSSAFQCARVQYKVWCKPGSGQADCRAMWEDASSGIATATDGAAHIYLIAGQTVDIFCDARPTDESDLTNVWLSDSRVEVELKVNAAFAKTGEKIIFQEDLHKFKEGLTTTSVASAQFTMVEKEPELCFDALKDGYQWNGLETVETSSNTATVRVTGGGGGLIAGGRIAWKGWIGEVITHPMDVAALLPQMDCKVTDVKVLSGNTTLPPEVLRRSAFLGPPRLDGESSRVQFLRDIVIDPSRLPLGTKSISVKVSRMVGGESIRELTTKGIPIVGATGESIVMTGGKSSVGGKDSAGSANTALIAAVSILSIAVVVQFVLLVLLWRKGNKKPPLTQEGIQVVVAK